MGTSLEEYAAQHPLPDLERATLDAGRSYREYLDDQNQARQLMGRIQNQLEQGTPPQYILYTAIKAIGLLTHDAEWAEAAAASLDGVYADLMQQSMLQDNEAAAAHRLEQMQADHNDKTRKQLQRSLNGYLRIEKALREALQEIDTITGEDP